jgi:myxalamid-type polyketide synthase MxaE and MxaD
LLLEQLREQSAAGRRRLMLAFVRQQVIEILELDRSRPVEPTMGFFELGLDSLTTVELRNRLQSALNGTVPATAAFDYPTIETLTDFLLSDVVGPALQDRQGDPGEPGRGSRPGPLTTAAPARETRANDLATMLDALEQLSEDEARARL